MSLNPVRLVLQPQITTTTSSNGSNINLPQGVWRGCILHLNVTAASGTSPTLNVYVQDVLQPAAATDTILNPPSLATSTQVFDDFASFTQATAAGDWIIRASVTGTSAGNVLADGSLTAASVRVGPIGMIWRVKWKLTATTPSFTWSLVAHLLP